MPGAGLGTRSRSILTQVINVGSGTDVGDFKAALEEHARTIAQEVRIMEIDWEREAVA